MRKIHLKLLVGGKVRELKDLDKDELWEGICACDELHEKLEDIFHSKEGAEY